MLFLLLVVSSILSQEFVAGDATCNMQGICGVNEFGVVPCSVQKEPHKFEDSSKILKTLKSECPELFKGGDDEIPDVCCSPDDVNHMQKVMKLIAMFAGSCSSCARNIKEMVCHAHCAPNQNEFLEITKTSASVNGSAIETIHYLIDKDSLESLFQSCSKVPMMKVMIENGCPDCKTAEGFARAIGDRKSRSPFELNVQLIEKGTNVQVNGKSAKPAEFLILNCSQTGSCGPNCA